VPEWRGGGPSGPPVVGQLAAQLVARRGLGHGTSDQLKLPVHAASQLVGVTGVVGSQLPDVAGDEGEQEQQHCRHRREGGVRRLPPAPACDALGQAPRPRRRLVAAQVAAQVVGQVAGRGVAVLGPRPQTLQADRFKVAREVRGDAAWRLQRPG
jgi:hypothetical protein